MNNVRVSRKKIRKNTSSLYSNNYALERCLFGYCTMPTSYLHPFEQNKSSVAIPRLIFSITAPDGRVLTEMQSKYS